MERIRLGLLVLMTLLWPSHPLFAQQQQGSKIHMHAAEGYAADGFLFAPQGQGPFAAVLLIHDSDGLTDYVRAAAERLAANGKVVVAVDLYHGRNASTAEQAQQLARELSEADAMHDLGAAVVFLRSLPTVRTGAIGVAAWGRGGRYALQLLEKNESLRAVAIIASEVPDVELPPHCATGFMGSFAGDASALAGSLQAKLGATNRVLDIKAYPQARGRFYDPAAATYRAEDSADVRDRLVRFFEAALDAPHPSAGDASTGRELPVQSATPLSGAL
jgi:carboxymethylenebutenolidase